MILSDTSIRRPVLGATGAPSPIFCRPEVITTSPSFSPLVTCTTPGWRSPSVTGTSLALPCTTV